MTSHHDLRCPACRKRVRLASDFLGKRVACPYCKHAFEAKAENAIAPPKPSAPDPAVEALRGQVARLEEEMRALRQTADETAAGLRDELAASQASCRQTAEQLEALRTERDALATQNEAQRAHVERLRAVIKRCGITLD